MLKEYCFLVTFQRAVSVLLLFVLGPTVALRPVALDALLMHAHEYHFHAHAIALPESGPARDTHDDHAGHGHSLAFSLSADIDGRELVIVFPKARIASSGASSLKSVGSERPGQPWVARLAAQNAQDQARLPFATGPPPAFHCSPHKTVAVLLLNHALLL